MRKKLVPVLTTIAVLLMPLPALAAEPTGSTSSTISTSSTGSTLEGENTNVTVALHVTNNSDVNNTITGVPSGIGYDVYFTADGLKADMGKNLDATRNTKRLNFYGNYYESDATTYTAHLELKNTTTADATINGAELLLNPNNYLGTGFSLTFKDASVDNSDLSVTVAPGNSVGAGYKAPSTVSAADKAKITKIKLDGTLKAGKSVNLTVSLNFNPAEGYKNSLSVKTPTNNLDLVEVYTTPTLLWDLDDPTTANRSFRLMERKSDGTYVTVNDPALTSLLPKVGQVSQLIDKSGSWLHPHGIYFGKKWSVSLPSIQKVLQTHGYTVLTTRDGKQPRSSYEYTFTYRRNAGESDDHFAARSFYLEVHPVLQTKNLTYEQGNVKWDVVDSVASAANLKYLSEGEGGYLVESDASSDVRLVSIVDSKGNKVKTLDNSTPAGTYTVTVSHRLNNSRRSDMLITNTATVTIKPTAKDPTTPIPPTTPTKPVTPSTKPSTVSPSASAGKTKSSASSKAKAASSLAQTGSDVVAVLAVATVALLTGVALVAARRRRMAGICSRKD